MPCSYICPVEETCVFMALSGRMGESREGQGWQVKCVLMDVVREVGGDGGGG